MRSLAPMAAFAFAATAATACQSDTKPQNSEVSQAYCVNRDAQFYPYEGKPCMFGYMLGAGNCRIGDGHMVAVSRDRCVAMAGTVELPYELGLRKGL